MNNENETVRLFLSGPLMLLFFLSCLVVTALLATGIGWGEKLAGLSTRAAERLERGRLIPTLWGLSGALLVFAAAGVLINIKPLALFGLVLGLAGLALAGLGLGAASLMVGRDLLRALEAEETVDPLVRLRLGLAALFCAAFLPFVGWILVLLAAAAGIGAVLEALLPARR